MPPHTPRGRRDRGERGGTGRAGRPHRHHRRRLDHRRRQGRADVPCQRHPRARGHRRAARGQGRRRRHGPAADEGADGAADQRADHALGRRVQRHRRRHRRAHEGEGAAAPSAASCRSAVVLDPAITVHTPEWLWLSTGIRAVDHCVEGVCSNEANAYGDAQALQGLALLASGLPRVKADPKDLAARLDCQMGTWLSMGAARRRRADGREPRHRLCAGRRVRRAARPHLLHHAAGGHALEQAGQRGAASAGVGGHGACRQGCGRRAGRRSSAGSACRAASVR